MLARGAALNVVMSIVGHKKIATTDVYNRLAGVGKRKHRQTQLWFALPKISRSIPYSLCEKEEVKFYMLIHGF